jgi:hydrogenase expression/formation protein HypC
VCLGIPGEILATHAGDLGLRMGTVRFGGAEREVCLAYVPEAEVGDYVIVHVGVAISTVSEEEATEVFGYLQEIQALADQEDAERVEGTGHRHEAPLPGGLPRPGGAAPGTGA